MNIACTPTFFFSTFFFLFFLFFFCWKKEKYDKSTKSFFRLCFFYLFYASHFAFYMRDTFLIISIFENYFTFKLFNKKKHLNTLLHTLRTNIHYTTAPLVSVWLWKRTFFEDLSSKYHHRKNTHTFSWKNSGKKEISLLKKKIVTQKGENLQLEAGRFFGILKRNMFVHFFVTITVWEFSS